MNPGTEATRALVEQLFRAYEQGDAQPLFEHVADDVRWTVTGGHPLSGEYRSKAEFLAATFERVSSALEGPIQMRVRRVIADGDVAVVEWHGTATSIAGRPYDNDYCWVLRLDGEQIVEVTAYLDGFLVGELFSTTGR